MHRKNREACRLVRIPDLGVKRSSKAKSSVACLCRSRARASAHSRLNYSPPRARVHVLHRERVTVSGRQLRLLRSHFRQGRTAGPGSFGGPFYLGDAVHPRNFRPCSHVVRRPTRPAANVSRRKPVFARDKRLSRTLRLNQPPPQCDRAISGSSVLSALVVYVTGIPYGFR